MWRTTIRLRLDRRIIFLTLALGLALVLTAPAMGSQRPDPGTSGEGESARTAARPQSTEAPPAVSSESHRTPTASRPPSGRGDGHQRPRPNTRHRYPTHRPGYGGHVTWGWGGWWGAPYWGGYGGWYPYGAPSVVVYQGHGSRGGALDLDVSPEGAAVYLDGEYVGVCDDFDGFPDFLWVEPGTYDLVIFAEGYQTIARQVTIERGVVLDLEDRMELGEAVKPEDLVSKSRVRRDERLRRDRERSGEVESGVVEAAPAPSIEGALDARGEPGRFRLQVEPKDSSVYLDGRFLGTGEELARLHAGLLVDAGTHRLEIVRPGFGSVEKSFEAVAGESVDLSVTLEED